MPRTRRHGAVGATKFTAALHRSPTHEPDGRAPVCQGKWQGLPTKSRAGRQPAPGTSPGHAKFPHASKSKQASLSVVPQAEATVTSMGIVGSSVEAGLPG